MRAAWGALKGAVQELNDALLEDDDERTEARKNQSQEHISYPRDRIDRYTQNPGTDKTKQGIKGSKYSNNNAIRGVFSSDHHDSSSLIVNSISENKKVGSTRASLLNNQQSVQNVIMLQDSDNSADSDSMREDFDWGLGIESTLDNEINSKPNNIPSEYKEKLDNCPNTQDSHSSEEKCSDEYISLAKTNEISNTGVQSEYECDDKSVALDDEQVDDQSLENSLEGSLVVTEDDEQSNITETFENGENRIEDEYEKTVSNDSDDDYLKALDLPSKYSEELSEIFHMEINSVDYLLKVIKGYYSDWKGIRDTIIEDRDLLLKLTPPHYESYLRNTVLDESKPFSLGFSVLIGQCISSLLYEFKKKLLFVTEQEKKIDDQLKNNVEQSTRLKAVEAENTELIGKISSLREEINYLTEKNKEMYNKMEKETQEKELIDRTRLESLEVERNNLIERINKMIAEKDESKIEVDRLHDHINNLTSIIEGYQAEEEQINSRYEIELERARSQERMLQSRLSILDSCQDEIHSLKGDISRLEDDKSALEKCINELKENNENLLSSNEHIMRQLKEVKDEQKEFMIDKRFIIQIIQKHNEDGSRIKYRNDLFNLLCDAIGISEEERSNIFASDNKSSSQTREDVGYDLNQGMGFADLFYNFLNSEVEENQQDR
ncbi:coiled coil-containing protein [Cryptosporidium canis]|uniref:Coiled coil-containing protein n=1 Tax=Cryptosporidium canis TaxID=195482 RepID=A0A9D5DGJ0_9CRYT|nr:coiled coil-containing protein [Cryptosporidium canis]